MTSHCTSINIKTPPGSCMICILITPKCQLPSLSTLLSSDKPCSFLLRTSQPSHILFSLPGTLSFLQECLSGPFLTFKPEIQGHLLREDCPIPQLKQPTSSPQFSLDWQAVFLVAHKMICNYFVFHFFLVCVSQRL